MIARLLSDRKAMLGLGILAAFVLMATVGPWLVGDPTDFVARPHEPPSRAHWLGTTGQGQDVLAQTVVGARVTLAVAVAVGIAVTAIGAAIGVAAGYFGGWIDEALGLVSNVFLVMPGLPLAVVIAAFMPAGPTTIALVLVWTGWAWNARVLRSQALSLRRRDFVLASIVDGETPARIIVFEILPNMLPLLVSCFISATIYALGAQVGLEFLGLGDIGTVSWGTILYWASNDAALLTGSWWIFVPVGACVAFVGFGLVMLNFAVDELSSPRLHAQGRWRIVLEDAGVDVQAAEAATPVVRRS